MEEEYVAVTISISLFRISMTMNKGDFINLLDLPPCFKRETNFAASCFWTSSKKGFLIKDIVFPLEANSF